MGYRKLKLLVGKIAELSVSKSMSYLLNHFLLRWLSGSLYHSCYYYMIVGSFFILLNTARSRPLSTYITYYISSNNHEVG